MGGDYKLPTLPNKSAMGKNPSIGPESRGSNMNGGGYSNNNRMNNISVGA